MNRTTQYLSLPNFVIFALATLAGGTLRADEPIWTRVLTTPPTDSGLDLDSDAAGNLYFLGSTARKLNFLTKYSPTGELEWLTQSGGQGFFAENGFFTGLAVAPNGDSFVVGTASTQPGQRHAFAMKFDSSGHEMWRKKIASDPRKEDYASEAAAAADGSVFVAGFTTGSLASPNDSTADGFLEKLDSNGTPVWTRQFGGDQPVDAFSVVTSQDAVFVTGRTSIQPIQGATDVYVAKFDATTGASLWTSVFGTQGYDTGEAITVDPSGAIVVSGTDDLYPTNSLLLAKLSSDGNLEWLHTYPNYGQGEAASVALSEDGAIVVGGGMKTPPVTWLRRFASDGSLLDSASFRGYSHVKGLVPGNGDVWQLATSTASGDAAIIAVQVPEPSALFLALLAGLGLMVVCSRPSFGAGPPATILSTVYCRTVAWAFTWLVLKFPAPTR